MKETDIITENKGMTVRKYYEKLYANKLNSDDTGWVSGSHKWPKWHKNGKHLCDPLPAGETEFMTDVPHERTHPSQRQMTTRVDVVRHLREK